MLKTILTETSDSSESECSSLACSPRADIALDDPSPPRGRLLTVCKSIEASSRESSPGRGREVMNCCLNCEVSFFVYEDDGGRSLQYCSKGNNISHPSDLYIYSYCLHSWKWVDCEVSALLKNQQDWQSKPACGGSTRRRTQKTYEDRSDSPLARHGMFHHHSQRTIAIPIMAPNPNAFAGNREAIKTVYPSRSRVRGAAGGDDFSWWCHFLRHTSRLCVYVGFLLYMIYMTVFLPVHGWKDLRPWGETVWEV